MDWNRDLSENRVKYFGNSLVAIIIVVLVTGFFRPSDSIFTSIQEGNLILSYTRRQYAKSESLVSDSPAMSDIAAFELTDSFDKGQMREGVQSRSCMAGTWVNDVDGEYRLYAYADVGAFIRIKLADGRLFVINFEDAKTTELFYEAVADYLEKTSALNIT